MRSPGGQGPLRWDGKWRSARRGILRSQGRLQLRRLLPLNTEFDGHTVFGANASSATTPSSAYLMTLGGVAPGINETTGSNSPYSC